MKEAHPTEGRRVGRTLWDKDNIDMIYVHVLTDITYVYIYIYMHIDIQLGNLTYTCLYIYICIYTHMYLCSILEK